MLIMNSKKKIQNETIVNGCKVYIDNGEVKTILSEGIEQTGYMTVDEMYNLVDVNIRKIYEMSDGLSS